MAVAVTPGAAQHRGTLRGQVPMEFRVLGSIEVIKDGRRLTVATGRQLGVLAFLLIHANRVVSAERIVDELWGDEPCSKSCRADARRQSSPAGVGPTPHAGTRARAGRSHAGRPRLTPRLLSATWHPASPTGPQASPTTAPRC